MNSQSAVAHAHTAQVVIMISVQCILGLLLCMLSTTVGAPKRCLLYMEKCVPHCPPDMYPYHTQCDKDTLSQRTCDNPDPINLGFTCGWSRCDCNDSLVLFDDGSCGPYKECFPRHMLLGMRGVRPRHRNNGSPKHDRRMHRSELKDFIDKS